MRLGLVTDIHNHAFELATALDRFRSRAVDQVLTLGDTLDPFAHDDGSAEVAALLRECDAVGVWGNHDFTLCREVSPAVRDRYPPLVLEVMGRMLPRMVLGDCHFSHREASVDPLDIYQLWELSGDELDLMAVARLGFNAEHSRIQFVGHYHRWWAGTPEGPLPWNGEGPLHFEPNRRYFVVVAAVCQGWCGILDTEQGLLEPLRYEPSGTA